VAGNIFIKLFPTLGGCWWGAILCREESEIAGTEKSELFLNLEQLIVKVLYKVLIL
jgi:hypothetical protein